MTTETRKRSSVIVVGITVLLLVAGAALWWMSNNAGGRDVSDSGWTFTSVRSDETLETAKNEPIVYPGDRFLARGPVEEGRFAYILLQDERKFEEEASLARDAQLAGQMTRFAGVQVSRGGGQVRMVVINAPTELEDLPAQLRAANLGKKSADERLQELEARLKALPDAGSTEISASSWYRMVAMPGYVPPRPAAPANAASTAPAASPVP